VSVAVEVANHVTDELVAGLNHLLPQLSTSASPLSADQVGQLVRSASSTLFVAREDRRIVGTLTLVVFAIPTGVRAWIEDVVVDETFRGGGVGEALTLAAIGEAKSRGVRSIDLTSRPTRAAANALYLKLGFDVRETNVYRLLIEPESQPR
jgi:ribosomal protein S18 acetylase RimI-like enzyme